MALLFSELGTQFDSLCSNASQGNSSSNETNELWLVQDRTSGQVTAAFLLLIAVLALPWNLLIVGVILKEKLFKQPTILLLLNLVLADLIIILLVMPFQIATGIQGEFTGGWSDSARCDACYAGIITAIFPLITLLTVAVMSFDRFMFIYKPLRYDQIMSSGKVAIVLLIMWVIATVIAVLPLAGFGNIIFFPPFLACMFHIAVADDSLYPVLILAVIGISIFVITFFNVWVIWIVQKNIRIVYQAKKSKGDQPSTGDSDFYKNMKKKRNEKQLHLLKVFGGLFLSNLITWLPLTSVAVYVMITEEHNKVPIELYSAVHVLFLTQVLLHPIVETAFVWEVKHPIKKLITCYCLRNKSAIVEISSPTVKEDSQKSCCKCEVLSVLGSALLPQHSVFEASNKNVEMTTSTTTDNI